MKFSLLSCVFKKLDLMGEIFEKRTNTSEAFFLGRWLLESPPLPRLCFWLFCKVDNDHFCQQENMIQKITLYNTGVIFQQVQRPSGTLLKWKMYFSGKHKMYGFKTEGVCDTIRPCS